MITAKIRKIVLGGGAALVAVGVLAGCSPTTEKDAPATSTSSTPTSSSASSAPAVSPTEKAAGPGITITNSFAPTVHSNPGPVCNRIVDGVCQR